MVTPVAMEIMVHSEMGRLDLEEEGGREEKGSGPPELEQTFRISAFQVSHELQEYSII